VEQQKVHSRNRNLNKDYIKNAAVPKGIAAFFISTYLDEFSIEPIFPIKIVVFILKDAVKSCGFLLAEKADKPCCRPRCRSPPSLRSKRREVRETKTNKPKKRGYDMYYKNQDYTVWTRETVGLVRYFIKFHSQLDSLGSTSGIGHDSSGFNSDGFNSSGFVSNNTDSKGIEITHDIFQAYLKEFNKPLERQRNEKRRHLEAEDMESLIESGRLAAVLPFEREILARVDIYAALEKCTEIQRRRVIMHYALGYSFTEIARIEGCNETPVRRSILAALKKIKNFLQGVG
jgi:RNA polymerase sigma-70 factor (ECF subfamily)